MVTNFRVALSKIDDHILLILLDGKSVFHTHNQPSYGLWDKQTPNLQLFM